MPDDATPFGEAFLPDPIDDPLFWLARAIEMRVKADQANDPEAKAQLADAAETYEELAHWAQKHTGRLH
jgi:hypothetical protein